MGHLGNLLHRNRGPAGYLQHVDPRATGRAGEHGNHGRNLGFAVGLRRGLDGKLLRLARLLALRRGSGGGLAHTCGLGFLRLGRERLLDGYRL